MNKETSVREIWLGESLYTKLFLSVYDWLALGLHCRFLWRCSSGLMLQLYNENVSANHLDVGVGTGYFLDRCKFPTTTPRLALMDINPDCLARARNRLARYSPKTYCRNALEPVRIDTEKFDSIGMMNLLHCLPGSMNEKSVVFENLKELLTGRGVVFGSTILPDIRRNPLATFTLKMGNRMGFMNNINDSAEGLKQILCRHFSEIKLTVVGCVALFQVR